MNHHRRRFRRPALRRRFLPDWLEPRWLLAAGLPGITAVTFDTAVSPPQVEITFNQNDIAQIDGMLAPFTGLSGDANLSMVLNVLDSASDFEIDQVASDGTTVTQVLGPNNPPPMENVSDVTVGGVPSVQVAIPIPGAALQPGQYQVCVEGSTTLDFLFDIVEPGSAWDAVAGGFQPVPIGQFTVLGQGATFQDATPLPAPGPAITTVMGYLNPDDYRTAVDLYQFTLGPTQGNLWQVGFEVQAHDLGSPLQADLTLFQADGEVVASALSGTGLPADPGDPYLFAGLTPGTYYVAVSGAGYLPYGPTGYDPRLGSAGVLGLSQPGGPFPFDLSMIALPHPDPTTVTASSVQWLDTLGSSPTSLTLDFSGPIDPYNLFVVDQAEDALELVDSTNTVWPITPDSYDVSQHQLTMLIDEPLPAGTYRLISPSNDALRDLAGVAVVAPGEPTGVLATFSVPAQSGAPFPGDLGVLWPYNIAASPGSIGGTVGGSLDLQPGQAATYRFVAMVSGLYKLQTVVSSGSISVQQFAPTGMNTLDSGSNSHINNYIMSLGTGVYQIRFDNVGAQPAQFQWRLKIVSGDWEKIFMSGVGQEPALALDLLLPSAADASAAVAPASQGPAAFPAPAVFQAPSAGGGPSGPVPSNLLVTLDTSLMGQPGLAAPALAPVGPSVEGASVALADSARGLMPNIRYASMLEERWGDDNGNPAPAPGAIQANGAGALPAPDRLDPEAARILADERALFEGQWLSRVAGMVRDWFGPMPADGRNPASGLDPARALVALRAARGPKEHAAEKAGDQCTLETAARADLEFPAGLLVIAVAAYRLKGPVRRFWQRRIQSRGKAHRAFRPRYPAPHAPSSFARATTRVQK